MAPSSGEQWSPEHLEREALPASAPTLPSTDLLARRKALTLTDVVDIALRNSPTTRISWSNARAAAARLGAARPSATFTWLLFDFNRGPSITSARQALAAADWTHNAAVQDVVLQVGQAYYSYAAARALLVAQRVTKAEADSNLAAAEERQRVGVATIAEVLQARTVIIATGVSWRRLAIDGVESLISVAMASRPDLAAAAATWQQSRADARAAYGKRLPSLTAQGNAGRTYLSGQSDPRQSYTVGVGLSIPIFNGFTWEYDAEAAAETARAQAARAEQLGQRAVLEVFTDYYALRTATQSVLTTEELFASAEASAQAALGRYRAGVGSLLELLTAESALGSARALRIQSRLSWHVALLQLAHDVGVLDVHGGNTLRVTPDSTITRPR